MIKKITFVLTISLVLLIILYIFPWTNKIDTALQGVQCRIGNSDYSKDVFIKVYGVYKNYLFRTDTFEGTISIDIYDYTLEAPIYKAAFFNGIASLYYFNSIGTMNSLGTLVCTPSFDKLVILVSEPVESTSKGKSWHGENGLFISAPAKNREQALEIARKLPGNSKWFSNINWK